MRPATRLAGLSPRRRALIAVVALIVVALAVAGGIGLTRPGPGSAPPEHRYVDRLDGEPLLNITPEDRLPEEVEAIPPLCPWLTA